MFRYKYIFVFLITVATNRLFAIDFDIRVFSTSQLKTIKITPLSGKYGVFGDSKKIADIYKNNSIQLSVKEGKINITKEGESLGSFAAIEFSADGFLNTFILKPLEPDIRQRVYDDGLKLSIDNNGFLKIINKVELEHYVAGVVESEGDVKKNLEFLKVQAIISRTYAISNLRKHIKDEGYNFCDDVHCQVYRGRSTNSMIMMAISQTTGMIIIDITNKPISAAFHSNCGGETANSEDVWSVSTTYLKSVNDTFCLHQSQARWEKKIPTKDWLNYLSSKYNFPVSDSAMRIKAITFSQPHRKMFFDDNPNIPMKTVRSDWKLKSAFFSIEDHGDTLLFRGRGYGHGVGLCQEGAIHMVDLGWTYKDIIKYYYKGVSFINITELKPQ
ncbi:MAG: SpoIID/LytB domain-containing protein [Bacteroidales bacterium]|jgi:stage II sporulation protein D